MKACKLRPSGKEPLLPNTEDGREIINQNLLSSFQNYKIYALTLICTHKKNQSLHMNQEEILLVYQTDLPKSTIMLI